MSSGRRRVLGLWPLGLYVVLSLLLFGLPVIGHLDSRIVAADQIDSSAAMWFLAWWPHAILHGLNPFVEHLMFVPEGFNLTWSASLPGPAVLLSPITLAFGPAVTWNVIQLASPALSAWTAFLLCRHVTRRTAPSLVGGYVFGFSPYMLINLAGAPNLGLLVLVPVLVLLVLRRVEGTMRRGWFAVTMALALAGQYLISSEVLATATLFGAVAVVLAWALLREQRDALRATLKPLVLAYIGAGMLISPFLVFFLFGHHYPPGRTGFSSDVASLALPPALVALAHHRTPFIGSSPQGYLGVGLIALIAVFAWQERRRRVTWVLVGTLLVALVCALGKHLVVRGHRTSIPAPWLLFSHLPVLRYAIPVRLVVFALLPAAVIVALFLARPPDRRAHGHVWRWALALFAVALIAPDVGNRAWNTPIKDPAFFSSGTYRAYLKPSDHVLTVPVWGPNQRWQADTGFRFLLADGYAGNPFPASYTRYPTYETLLTGHLNPDSAAQLRQFVRAKGVTAIVVDKTIAGPWTTLFGTLGVHPVSTGGVLVYRLGRP